MNRDKDLIDLEGSPSNIDLDKLKHSKSSSAESKLEWLNSALFFAFEAKKNVVKRK
jgi:hypothetical protein